MPKTTSKNKPQLFLLLIGIPLVIFSLFALFFLFPKQKGNTNSKRQTDEIMSQKERMDIENKRSSDYFISDIFPQYPTLLSEIPASNITQVFPFTLKDTNLKDSRGWIVEVNSNGKSDYYLISALSQTKLDHPMTGATGEDAECTLSEAKFVGNEAGLNRDLIDKNGYVVLSGQDCIAYGGGEFVSVYKMTDGKKVPLKGDFLIPGATNYKGVSQVGNAQGRLRGVYGVNDPMLVVEYGGFESAGSKLEEVRLTAYFDLQTGTLKQLIKFD